ncbi:MAG: adenosylmethionine decarboxylase [Pseudomonadota bacterium]
MSKSSALFQLGMDKDDRPQALKPSTARTRDENTPLSSTSSDKRYDHFITRNGIRCAGTHIIIDLHEANGLDDLSLMEKALRDCVNEAKATLLHIHLHHFEPNGGISGVAVLAESHISVHSWPEAKYAAFDVFMCGDAEPELCVEVLRRAFAPQRVVVSEVLRGKGA